MGILIRHSGPVKGEKGRFLATVERLVEAESVGELASSGFYRPVTAYDGKARPKGASR